MVSSGRRYWSVLGKSSNREFAELVATTRLECTEMDPGYWFADENDEDEKYGHSEQVIARTVCGRCLIRKQCFQYAIENDIQHGVWGGAVPAQRQGYKNRMTLYPKTGPHK